MVIIWVGDFCPTIDTGSTRSLHDVIYSLCAIHDQIVSNETCIANIVVVIIIIIQSVQSPATLVEISYIVFTSCYLKKTFGGDRRKREHCESCLTPNKNQPLPGYSALSEVDCLTKLENSVKAPFFGSLALRPLSAKQIRVELLV